MSFHRNLTGLDLHAPTLLPIENSGNTGISKGEVLVVSGYNTVTKRYRVRRAVDIGEINDRSPIFGIAEEQLPAPFDNGRMISFGIAEGSSIILTKNTEPDDDPAPLVVGNTVYADTRALIPGTDDPNPNVGKLVSGKLGNVVEIGVIVDVTSTTTATLFFFGIAVGLTGISPSRALLSTIEFDTFNDQAGGVWINNTPAIGEKTGIIEHGLDTIDYIVEWYEYTFDGTTIVKTEPIEIAWQVDGSTAIKAILPFGEREQRIRGKIEIIY